MILLIVGAAFLAYVLFITLAVRYGTTFAGRIMGNRVTTMHQATEHILHTGTIPPDWLSSPPGESAKRHKWERRQRKRALKKLHKLQSYFQTTPCVADVGVREHLLMELERVERDWRQADLQEITATAPAAEQPDSSSP
jgi:hypothetical protein